MFTLLNRSVKIASDADTSSFTTCPDKVYQAWVAAIHQNKTPVAAGDSYIWLCIQLMPPRVINCIITVKKGDEYPPATLIGGADPATR